MNATPPFYFFFHFHKCAGSSIVLAFQKAGYRLNAADNGNLQLPPQSSLPRFKTSPRWERIGIDEQINLLNYGKSRRGYTFLAAERSFPSTAAVRSALEGGHLFTVLRDPWRRHLSNYRFSMAERQRAGKPVFPLSQFAEEQHFGEPNFFVRTLVGRSRGHAPLTAEHLQFALAWARQLDTIVVLEDVGVAEWLRSQRIAPPKKRLKRAPELEGLVFDVDEATFRKENEIDCEFYETVRSELSWRAPPKQGFKGLWHRLFS